MSTSRATFCETVPLLGAFLALCLASCEVPVLRSLSPDTAPQGEQNFQLALSGIHFDSRSRLVIDGSPEGIGREINLAQLTLVSTTQLTATLRIGPNAQPGAHPIAVANPSGISDPQYFYVSCPGCPPPPRLFEVVENHPFSSLVFQGSTDTIRILGRNLRDTSSAATISISGSGLSFDRNPAVVDVGSGDLQTIDIPITVQADARTGYREMRVSTAGGLSNPVLLEVAAPPSLAPGITEVTLLGAECLNQGDNFLIVRGYNFVPGTTIDVQYLGGGFSRVVTDINPIIDNSQQIRATVTVPEVVSLASFSTSAQSISGGSARYPTACQGPAPTITPTPTPTPSPGGPVITNVTPVRVGKGVEVLIKCEGRGFGASRQVMTDPVVPTTTYGVASAAANPDNVVVAKILPQAAGSLRVRVKNLTLQTISEEIVVFVDDPAPGTPVARGTTGDGVHRGAGFDLTVVGTNLQGLTNTSWGGIPGLTFSNTTSTATSATVRITADGTAPLTADEATNLTVTTPAGQSPPFLFRVFQ